jgi:hypothetical protein
VLAFREVVDKENREKIEEIQKLEIGKRQAEDELSQHRADGEKLNEELDRKGKLLEAQSEELKLRMTQIDKARLDFEQQRREREEAERSRLKQLTERAETYNLIKDKLIDLATKVENTDGKIAEARFPDRSLSGERRRCKFRLDRRRVSPS